MYFFKLGAALLAWLTRAPPSCNPQWQVPWPSRPPAELPPPRKLATGEAEGDGHVAGGTREAKPSGEPSQTPVLPGADEDEDEDAEEFIPDEETIR